MKLSLLDTLSKTPVEKPVEIEENSAPPAAKKSLLSQMGEMLDDVPEFEEELHEEVAQVIRPKKLRFFGVELEDPEHVGMEDEFEQLERSNPRLCNKILQLD